MQCIGFSIGTLSPSYCLAAATMFSVIARMSAMKPSLVSRPASIAWQASFSHSAVRARLGEFVNLEGLDEARSAGKAYPASGRTRARRGGGTSESIKPSIVWARVAGVPRPFSAIASRSSSPSSFFPAFSIAERSVASGSGRADGFRPDGFGGLGAMRSSR